MNLPIVKIYSDGGARPNPGPGGYGIVMKYKGAIKEFSGFEYNTTNNRMELTGAIVALGKLKIKSEVKLYTDSKYTIDGIEKGWAKRWRENDWMRTKTEKALNSDLWEELLELVEKHEVKFHWVKGHNGHIENERCDELATEQILKNISKSKFIDIDISKPLNKQDLIKKVLEKDINKSIKIIAEGQACRKCGTKVVKAIPKKKNIKNKSYYYKYYLNCPTCSTNYFVDEAKVMI